MDYTGSWTPESASPWATTIRAHKGGEVDRHLAEQRLIELQTELGELQELCFALAPGGDGGLAGMDTSGEGRHDQEVMDSVDPQSCRRHRLQIAVPLELTHDFLWRVHSAAPERRMLGIFNRSYEDVAC